MAKKELISQISKIAIFEGEEIRKAFFDGEWYFSIEDIVRVLTDSSNPKGYLKDMRRRDEEISKGWGQIATPLPMTTNGGKQSINCANTESVFRLIQSIPSKKAEPFKRWLARVGKERLDEIEQPERAIERGRGYYIAKGYPQQWVETRTASIDTRHKFTDVLKEGGIKKSYEYAILTNELYSSSFGLSAIEYKEYKGLNIRDSLRDHMTPLELASVIFSEATSTELIIEKQAKGFVETKSAIHFAGSITREAIEKLEKETGKKVITHSNAKELDSPEIRKELVQQSIPTELRKNPKKALSYKPKDKE